MSLSSYSQQTSLELNHNGFKYALHMCGKFAAFSCMKKWLRSISEIFFFYFISESNIYLSEGIFYCPRYTFNFFLSSIYSQTFKLMDSLILAILIRKLHLQLPSCFQIYILSVYTCCLVFSSFFLLLNRIEAILQFCFCVYR